MSYLTVKQTAEKHQAFSQNSLRWTIFNSKFNGAEVFIRRVGRKILIDDDKFIAWIDSHRGA